VKVLIENQALAPTICASRFYTKEESPISFGRYGNKRAIMFFGIARIEQFKGLATTLTPHDGIKWRFI
jgi:hypothetical protein